MTVLLPVRTSRLVSGSPEHRQESSKTSATVYISQWHSQTSGPWVHFQNSVQTQARQVRATSCPQCACAVSAKKCIKHRLSPFTIATSPCLVPDRQQLHILKALSDCQDYDNICHVESTCAHWDHWGHWGHVSTTTEFASPVPRSVSRFSQLPCVHQLTNTICLLNPCYTDASNAHVPK